MAGGLMGGVTGDVTDSSGCMGAVTHVSRLLLQLLLLLWLLLMRWLVFFKGAAGVAAVGCWCVSAAAGSFASSPTTSALLVCSRLSTTAVVATSTYS